MPVDTSPHSALDHQTIELLQALIRNECVNDGTPDSGGESRNADLLQSFLEGAGLDIERFEARPGRGSIVARIEGSDPAAPTLCLMGHTDVVPVNPDGWSHDPFGGELIDGEVWGRGAIDMLNLTSSMAVAFRHLATTGLPAEGHADLLRRRRRGGRRAVGRRVDVRAPPRRDPRDYVLTELGGWSSIGHDGTRRVTVNVGEKGLAWRAPARHRHARATARCRSAPTTRWSRRPRSCAALVDVPAGRRRSATSGAARWRRCRCPTRSAPALIDPDRI